MAISIITPGPTIDAETVGKIERKFAHRFPSDYREFLLTRNGGTPETNEFDIRETNNGSGVQGSICFTASLAVRETATWFMSKACSKVDCRPARSLLRMPKAATESAWRCDRRITTPFSSGITNWSLTT
jgi:hypothetical protein